MERKSNEGVGDFRKQNSHKARLQMRCDNLLINRQAVPFMQQLEKSLYEYWFTRIYKCAILPTMK